LTLAGKHGSFTAKNAKAIGLRSANYDSATNQVSLVPTKPFALKKPVQLQVLGTSPSGLQDSDARFIDGNRDGQAGGNAVAILTKGGAKLAAVALATPSVASNTATNGMGVLPSPSESDTSVHPPSQKKNHG